ncbi:LacI family DNA-binding transcriptional regulator [Clavibacter michiganensis subsp. phaseoli]|uniref:LacI family DNA-binding transcriptional regulator n=1 Tax=Clavibacter phaseoli TaxID=1734031 RepID=A0A8I0VCR2_9MICO|nr:LacI family DNA-binding transcriptional regulator [Clavibacter phaseoli]MBF4631200.1 LacI family DNA-binding transcriptional regulator [Clavibacter phaseoli]
MSVSIRDVAARAGVSVGTVSNVLNRPERVNPAAVRKVQAAIAELGFVRNDAARQLRAGRSRSIGLVVLDSGNPFFAELARGAQARAADAGLAVLLGSTDGDAGREDAYIDLFEEQRVTGVLISPQGESSARIARLRAHGIPCVLVDREADDPEHSSVAVDDVAGGRLAVEHLLELGRRRIAVLGGPTSVRQVSDRVSGARAAVAAVPGATLEEIPTAALSVLAGREAGRAIADRDPGERPDAVFAANDLVAVGVLQALALIGDIRVPEDVALIGYDDIAFASATVVPLSSIRQPSALIGATAVDLLLGDAPRQVLFQPELVIRASTGG